MGILDKAKERATQLAGQAKEKIEDVKEKRKVDDMYRDLGKILYRQRTQDGRPTDDAEIVRLVAELREHEAEEARSAASTATTASTGSAPSTSSTSTPSTPSTSTSTMGTGQTFQAPTSETATPLPE